MKFSSLLTLGLLNSLTFAKPTTAIRRREVDPIGDLTAILQGVTTAVSQGDPTGVLTALQNVLSSAAAPTTPQGALAALQNIFNGTGAPPATLYQYIATLEALNLIDSVSDLLAFVQGVATGQDSPDNNNPPPPDTIYPQKSSCDAPYSVDEATLRAAIYIPPTFTYGRIPPVILFPGTGNYGYETFSGNFIPLLQGSTFADPVWVNVPGRLLNDAQKNAEFAAYAINYISSVTHGNITLLGWSQGNIDTQWAFKYWPSTTQVTSDHVAVSPDYAGTIIANFVALPGEPLPPSVLQQEYLASSNFITTLRTCNGDSGYVPTTTVYSGFFDEIVEPQQGTGASAFLNDFRGVGVTNNQVQLVCAGQPAGTFYTHEGVLYNPLAYYLLRDAMTNPGPGNPNRLDLPTVCSTYLTPGLNLGNFLVTENAIAIAGLAILTYPTPVFQEPAISAYATTCPVSTCLSTSTTTTTSTSTSTSTSSSSTTTSSSVTTTTTSSGLTSSTTGSTSTSTSSTSRTTGSATGTTTSSTSTSTSTTGTNTSTGTSTSTGTNTNTGTNTSTGMTSTSSTLTTSTSTTTSSTTGTNSGSLTTSTGISTSYTTTYSQSLTWNPWNSWPTTTGSTTVPEPSSGANWSTWAPAGAPSPSKSNSEPETETKTWAGMPYVPSDASVNSHSTWKTWSASAEPSSTAIDAKPTGSYNDAPEQSASTWADANMAASPTASWSDVNVAASGTATWASADVTETTGVSTWAVATISTSAPVAEGSSWATVSSVGAVDASVTASVSAVGTGAAWNNVNGTGVIGQYKGGASRVALSGGLVMGLVGGALFFLV